MSMVADTHPQGPIIPELYPKNHGKPRTLGPAEAFFISSLAPALAVIFTNPFDTAKVRLQLQGERMKQIMKAAVTKEAGELAAKNAMVYKGSFDCLQKIYINEGLKGLQKGLTPAMLRESSKNFFRLGMYDPIMSAIHNPADGSPPAWKRVIVGSICGAMGALSCNPFELVKTRLQSSAAGKIAVGHQHGYTGVISALRSIVSTDGWTGLYRGSLLSVARSIAGSGSNLAAYSMLKEYLISDLGWEDGTRMDVVAGLGSGIVSCIFMNPIDVVRTRYYNQPYKDGKGLIYSSGLDTIKKLVANEGVTAFYKGALTHFLRIGPHFCLTFVFLGWLRRGLSDYYARRDLQDSFSVFDEDGNGTLDRSEVFHAIEKIFPRPLNLGQDEYRALLYRYASQVIATADRNKDSVISFDEYDAAIKEIKKLRSDMQFHKTRTSFA
ncbi:mitochondrial carrier domain-containing protein [Polychytrium aggregatum]|uniref:mitochondrial carrier domain-containing protein n=1 Tax=Polychytrium aggregatum TaxID=110093 RepID=UPI0022FE234C|nr:mitochondrial carrier domain-containing protein [Polychytrium aggregatum]KAI9205324.1 mitochondrial carrier domain-containing protein [Polychytrium aggregatum]